MEKLLWLALIFIILLSSFISAQCNDTQIDINSATLEELDKIITIGPVTAEKIILMRPFYSVDDLIDVSGIGNKTLEKIKLQNLACVDITNANTNQVSQSNEEESFANNASYQNSSVNANSSASAILQNQQNSYGNAEKTLTTFSPKTAEVILLNSEQDSQIQNSKSIKTNENAWSLERIATYGLIAFSIFIASLLIAKKIKGKKTEFEK